MASFSIAALLAIAVMLCLASCGGGAGSGEGTGAGDNASAASVQVKDVVNDYSWEELSALSAEIAAAADDEAALALAKRYHLAADDGTLNGTQAKDVELANGSVTKAIIAGFNHEDRPGGGKAGITFVFADAVAMRGMNNNAGFDYTSEGDDYDAVGGWSASEVRGWLNSDFVNELPSDLQVCLADVVKACVVVPEDELMLDDRGALLAPTDSLVGEGIDKLWIPAVVELSGVSKKSESAEECPEWTAPLRAEGAQYQLFADQNVRESNSNAILERRLVGGSASDAAQAWWLRSVEGASFAEVTADGAIDRRTNTPFAAAPQGIVACFAL